MKRRVIELTILAMLALMIVYTMGCSGSAGVRDGAIKGRIATTDGNDLPQIKIRVEGLPATDYEPNVHMSKSNPFSRYIIVDNSDGYYMINDVPVGAYALTAYAVGYDLSGTEAEGPTGTSSEVTMTAWIENGGTYEVPTIYVRPRASRNPGTVKGKVYDNTLGQIISVAATVTIGGFSVNTDANGEYSIAGLVPQEYSVDCYAPGFKQYTSALADGIQNRVFVVPGKEVEYDIYLSRGEGTISVTVVSSANDPYPALFAAETFSLELRVNGIRFATTTVKGSGADAGSAAMTAKFEHVPMGRDLSYKVYLYNANYIETATAVSFDDGTIPGQPYGMIFEVTRNTKDVVFRVYGRSGDSIRGAVSVNVNNTSGGSASDAKSITSGMAVFNNADNAAVTLKVPYGSWTVKYSGIDALEVGGTIANYKAVDEQALSVSPNSSDSLDIVITR